MRPLWSYVLVALVLVVPARCIGQGDKQPEPAASSVPTSRSLAPMTQE